METRVSRAMERSTTDIELTFAKAERGNRQDCTDKGRGMGGTAEEGNKETAWKPVMFGINEQLSCAKEAQRIEHQTGAACYTLT
jgi:hypothetical protein